MNENHDDLAAMWENLLSRDPDLVRAAFSRLNLTSRGQVMDHLRRMSEEPGWHEEQVVSARIALETLAK